MDEEDLLTHLIRDHDLPEPNGDYTWDFLGDHELKVVHDLAHKEVGHSHDPTSSIYS